MVKRSWVYIAFIYMVASCSFKSPPVEIHTSEVNEIPETETPISEHDGISGTIAFIGSDGNVYLVHGFDSSVKKLTDDASLDFNVGEGLIQYQEPTWSPGEDQVAYVRSELLDNGMGFYRLDIFDLRTQASSTYFESNEFAPFYLYWSPDGTALSFLTSAETSQLNLWTVSMEAEAQVIDRGQPYYWTWFPDSGGVLSHVGGSVDFNPNGAHLRLVRLGEMTSVELAISPLNFQAPVFTPDGKRILVVGRQDSGNSGLYLLSRKGDVLVKLGEVEGRVAFDFSPSGRYLAVVSGPEVEGVHLGDLVIMDLADPIDPRTLPVIAEDVAAFWWSPVEDRLIYFSPNVVREDFTQPVRFERQGELTLRLEGHIHDMQTGQGYMLMAFKPTPEFFRILPYYDQYQRSATIWSPDGSQVVYAASLNGDFSGIFMIDVDGGQSPEQVGEGKLAFWSFR